MTLIIETGAGVRGANTYSNVALMTTYLTERGRETENSWDVITTAAKEASLIAATDYVEVRFGLSFLGVREFTFDATFATGSIVFAGLPADTETFLLGDQTYTYVTALTGAADEILIGADLTAAASNTSDAIGAVVAGAGVTYGTGTTASPHATASAASGTVALVATPPGSSGALTALTGSLTNGTLNVFTGGKDGGQQPLSFPRRDVYDRTGVEWLGIPLDVKNAIYEYAIRAASTSLLSDPTIDTYAGIVTSRKDKVGPIEQSFTYQDGSQGSILIKPYPAADRLLRDFLSNTGGVIR